MRAVSVARASTKRNEKKKKRKRKRDRRNGGKEKGSGLREKGAEKGALIRFIRFPSKENPFPPRAPDTVARRQ